MSSHPLYRMAAGIAALALAATLATAAAAEITATDLRGRTVTLAAPAQRIVITFNVEDVLAVLGPTAESRIVGWTHGYWEGRRQWIWRKYTQALPWLVELPDVGYVAKKTFSVEKTVALKPDLVVMPSSYAASAAAEVEKLERAGVAIAFIDYHTDTVATHQASTRLLGKLLGQEERAEKLARLYATEIAKVTDRLKGHAGPKPRAYFELGHKGPNSQGNSYGPYMWGSLIEAAGGDNITKDAVKKWGPVDPELVLARKPEVILIGGAYWSKQPDSYRLGYYQTEEGAAAGLEAFKTRKGWQTLPAVSNGRVYGLHHGLSRHIFDYAALQAIAKMLYPDLFADLDPKAAFVAFHRDWLPVDFSGVWIVGLDN